MIWKWWSTQRPQNGFFKSYVQSQEKKKIQEMIEPPLGRDDVILIYHRKKAELINSYFVVFSTFLLEQTMIGNLNF